MKRIILASHGPFCEGLLNTGKMIAGEETLKDVKTISITMSDSTSDIKERTILSELGFLPKFIEKDKFSSGEDNIFYILEQE